MAKSPELKKQIDLEEAIAKSPKLPQGELHDAFTGVLFRPLTRNHYEVPDPVPFAPHMPVSRPTVRQRVENLLQRGIDPLADFMRQQSEPDELAFEIPDDPEAPLTHAEQMHLNSIAADLAEQAPLPDEGLPRPEASPPASPAKAADAPGGGSQAAPSAPPKGAPAASAAGPGTVD